MPTGVVASWLRKSQPLEYTLPPRETHARRACQPNAARCCLTERTPHTHSTADRCHRFWKSENASRTDAQRVLPQLQLAEERSVQFVHSERGTLRIGMECHPCYEWLLKVVRPYLQQSPDVDVDVDVRQKFQFGGIGALLGFEIDLLPPPDPVFKPGLQFEEVFG